MLNAMVAGEIDPVKLAALAHKGVKASQEQLREALRGRVNEHHRFLLHLHLEQIDRVDGAIAQLDDRVEANLKPFRTAVELVATAPGIRNGGAETIVAEIGIDMSRFPHRRTSRVVGRHCRRRRERGKRRSTRLRRGNPWLKTALIQAAWAAKNKKGQLPASPVSTSEKPARSPKGDLCRRRLPPHLDLSHAQERGLYAISGPALQQPVPKIPRQPPRSPTPTPRLHRRSQPNQSGVRPCMR